MNWVSVKQLPNGRWTWTVYDAKDIPVSNADKDYATQRGADAGASMIMRRQCEKLRRET